MKNFNGVVLVAVPWMAGLYLAFLLLDFASAATSKGGSEWPIVKIGPNCYKKIYRETWHRGAGNSPAGSLTGCSGCFYGYDSESKVIMYRPVQCSR